MKHATNSEVLLFKRLIEQKLATLLNSSNSTLSNDLFSSLNEEEVVDFEFISNPQAIQTSVKNTFGYVRSRNSSGTNSVGSAHGSLRQQPPISRPTSSNRYVNKRRKKTHRRQSWETNLKSIQGLNMAQCHRMVNLQHFKKLNIIGNFHDFKQF